MQQLIGPYRMTFALLLVSYPIKLARSRDLSKRRGLLTIPEHSTMNITLGRVLAFHQLLMRIRASVFSRRGLDRAFTM